MQAPGGSLSSATPPAVIINEQKVYARCGISFAQKRGHLVLNHDRSSNTGTLVQGIITVIGGHRESSET